METLLSFTALGLLLDVLGVAILFFYHLPKSNYGWRLNSDPDENELAKIEDRNRRVSTIGLSLILLGFMLQFLAAISA